MKASASLSPRTLVMCLGLAILSSYSTSSGASGERVYVRKVDFSAVPKQQFLAEHARDLGNQVYPKVCALLADGKTTFPRKFDICLKRKLSAHHSGETHMTRICLDVGYLDQREDDDLEYFDHILIHEMTHVAQHYNRPTLGSWVVFTPHPPGCWLEGIADYVYFKLCQTNGQPCAQCGLRFPHYRDGYSCAGAFLLYVENTYNPNVVRQLNTVLRRGKFSDDFFLKASGKRLPELWTEFQQTSAFTPNAARMLKLQQTLGFVDGKPPKELDLRFKAFINQPANAVAKELLQTLSFPGSPEGDPSICLPAFLYFTQPGGTPETFMMKLQRENLLPGIGDARETEFSGPLRLSDMDARFPCFRSFTATKRGDPSKYHYTVYSPSPNTSWKLQRAWRTNPDGLVAEEYHLP